MLDRLCNDIILIVYRLLHRECLNVCFNELQSKLVWNDERMHYGKPNYKEYPRANWRHRPITDRMIYCIWNDDLGTSKLPANW